MAVDWSQIRCPSSWNIKTNYSSVFRVGCDDFGEGCKEMHREYKRHANRGKRSNNGTSEITDKWHNRNLHLLVFRYSSNYNLASLLQLLGYFLLSILRRCNYLVIFSWLGLVLFPWRIFYLQKMKTCLTTKSRRQVISSAGFQLLVSPAPHLERYKWIKNKMTLIEMVVLVFFVAGGAWAGNNISHFFSPNLNGWFTAGGGLIGLMILALPWLFDPNPFCRCTGKWPKDFEGKSDPKWVGVYQCKKCGSQYVMQKGHLWFEILENNTAKLYLKKGFSGKWQAATQQDIVKHEFPVKKI